jgi:hypothetical protein
VLTDHQRLFTKESLVALLVPNVQPNGLNDDIVSLSRNAEPQRDYRATVVVGQVNRRRGNDPQPSSPWQK